MANLLYIPGMIFAPRLTIVVFLSHAAYLYLS